MACASCGRRSHKGPDMCPSCKSIEDFNKPNPQPTASGMIQQGTSGGSVQVQINSGFRPQWQLDAERQQMEEARRRAQAAQEEADMRRILGFAGMDVDQIYRQMQGRGGPKRRDYSGKPKKVMIIKLV